MIIGGKSTPVAYRSWRTSIPGVEAFYAVLGANWASRQRNSNRVSWLGREDSNLDNPPQRSGMEFQTPECSHLTYRLLNRTRFEAQWWTGGSHLTACRTPPHYAEARQHGVRPVQTTQGLEFGTFAMLPLPSTCGASSCELPAWTRNVRSAPGTVAAVRTPANKRRLRTVGDRWRSRTKV